METQWVLTRITKDKKAFIIGNPSVFIGTLQNEKKKAKLQYPGQILLVRNLEAFNSTPVPKKYQ